MVRKLVAKEVSSKARQTSKPQEYGPLISPARDRDKPVYNWHSFKHSYSKALVEKLINEFGLRKNSWVLDPFCGGGTTLLACKELGINSRGFDILPFSVFLTNVKTRNYDPAKLRNYLALFDGVEQSVPAKNTLPNIGIINRAFSAGVEKNILQLKLKIDSIGEPTYRDFYMLCLLSILESVSNTSKAGGFLRITKKRISKNEVFRQFKLRIEKMIDDVSHFNVALQYPNVDARARISDVRQLSSNRKFDAIITSPPYPNRHDYTRIYSLELIVGFIKNNDRLKQLRYRTLRSHVEAKRQYEAKNYHKPATVKSLIARIKRAGLNNPQIPDMIEGYFEDMFLSLVQMQKCLKKNGKLALVVSNVRFGGVNVPVDRILASLGELAGLSTTNIITARYRGNSAQQMGKYRRKPSRESIIIWENV